ncbi:Fic family protein [Gracilimonas tropica]|uniref:Fic family protein n=1 Tax=Gracilimonas tropica TaxID=454600 RepID=UPI0003664749|nr:Fic family protein [Gracilimonas tropica]
MSDSAELEQLRELIELFPAEYSIDDVEEANRIARTRFDALDNQLIPYLVSVFKTGDARPSVNIYLKLCGSFHTLIFKEIISINGEFRNSTHDGYGSVYFGGQKGQELKPRFTGSKPENIENDLREAFKFIIDLKSDTPVDNALRFYQKFVFAHPFYDGNGRIARLFVNLYLLAYGKFIDWKNLQDKGKFLSKLNYYHETGKEDHFKWWAKVCYKFVYEISDEDER